MSSFPEIVQPLVAFVDANRRQRTGWLELEQAPGCRHRVGFCGGVPVAIEMPATVVPLTEVVAQWEDVDRDLVQVLAMSGMPEEELARELLAARVLTRARLAEARRQQVLEQLAHLFALPPCPVAFHVSASNDDLASRRSIVFVPHAYLHFVRGTDAVDVAEDYLDRLEGGRLALAQDLDLHGLGFSPEEAEVAWRLAVEPRSVNELVMEGFSPAAVRAVAFTLALAEGVRVVRPSSPSRQSGAPRRRPTPSAPSAPPAEPPTSESPEPATSAVRRRRPTPASTFEDAEREMDRGNVMGAAVAVSRALDAEPDNPSLHAMKAFLSAQRSWQVSQEPAPQREAIDQLDRVLAATPGCALAYHYRGVVRRRLGETALALADQQEANRLNPYHDGTQQELRELERSSEPPPRRPLRWYERILRRA